MAGRKNRGWWDNLINGARYRREDKLREQMKEIRWNDPTGKHVNLRIAEGSRRGEYVITDQGANGRRKEVFRGNANTVSDYLKERRVQVEKDKKEWRKDYDTVKAAVTSLHDALHWEYIPAHIEGLHVQSGKKPGTFEVVEKVEGYPDEIRAQGTPAELVATFEGWKQEATQEYNRSEQELEAAIERYHAENPLPDDDIDEDAIMERQIEAWEENGIAESERKWADELGARAAANGDELQMDPASSRMRIVNENGNVIAKGYIEDMQDYLDLSDLAAKSGCHVVQDPADFKKFSVVDPWGQTMNHGTGNELREVYAKVEQAIVDLKNGVTPRGPDPEAELVAANEAGNRMKGGVAFGSIDRSNDSFSRQRNDDEGPSNGFRR